MIYLCIFKYLICPLKVFICFWWLQNYTALRVVHVYTVNQLLFAYEKFLRGLQELCYREYFSRRDTYCRIFVLTKRMLIRLGREIKLPRTSLSLLNREINSSVFCICSLIVISATACVSLFCSLISATCLMFWIIL